MKLPIKSLEEILNNKKQHSFVCDECKSQLIYDKKLSELICPYCGIVYEEKIPVLVGSRVYENNKESNQNNPLKLYSGTILGNKHDINKLSPKQKRKFLHLKELTTYFEPYILKVYREIKTKLYTYNRIFQFNDNVLELTLDIYLWLHKKGLIRGRGSNLVLLSSLWTSVKIMAMPYLLKDFSSKLEDINSNEILRNYKLIYSEMLNDYKKRGGKDIKLFNKIFNSLSKKDYVIAYFNKAGMPVRFTNEFIKYIDKCRLSLPIIIGSGIYYYSLKLKEDSKEYLNILHKMGIHKKTITQEVVSSYMNITNVSLRRGVRVITNIIKNEEASQSFQQETKMKT